MQFAAASLDRRIDALIPIITWNDLSYSLAPNNTSLGTGGHGVTYSTPGVHKKEWTSLFFAIGITDGIQGAGVDPTRLLGCPNFVDQACLSKAQLEAFGYPDQATMDFSRHASVSSYLSKVKAPTLLVQGQKDSLFNLQEAAATYRGMQAQGTPVQMIWQSWGHSLGGTPAPGELDLTGAAPLRVDLPRWPLPRLVQPLRQGRHRGDHRPGVRVLPGLGHLLRASRPRPTPARRPFPVGQPAKLYLSGAPGPGHRSLAGAARGADLGQRPGRCADELLRDVSQGGQATDPLPATDAPGTFGSWTSAPMSGPTVIVGSPTLDVTLTSPAAAATQATGPAGQLVVFAKIYDVAPDGTQTLHNRLVSPVRIADVTKRVHIELPGVVQRIAQGHRLRLVLAASDAAYAGNAAVLPVTVTANPASPAVLTLPVRSGAGPSARR